MKSFPLLLVVIGIVAQSAAASSHDLKAAFSGCSVPTAAQSDQQVSDVGSGCGSTATKVNNQAPTDKNSGDSHHCAVCCSIQHSFIKSPLGLSLAIIGESKLTPLNDSLDPLMLVLGILRPPALS